MRGTCLQSVFLAVLFCVRALKIPYEFRNLPSLFQFLPKKKKAPFEFYSRSI